MGEIYLDANASAPLRPESRAALVEVLDLGPGNASSPHGAGRRLRKALGDARDSVAALVGARPSEIVFTSGATESNALAILGALEASPGPLVTTRAEHSSVLRVAERVAAKGGEVRYAGVDRWGRYDAGEVLALSGGAAVVSATLAQSVTGAIEPASEVGRRLDFRTFFHVDAAQAAGRIGVIAGELRALSLSVSGHKMGGPQGIGALYVREGAPWRNPFGEGTQEMGRRAGTEAVALAAAFGAAARAGLSDERARSARAGSQVRTLRAAVMAIAGAEILTPEDLHLPNTLLVAFDGCPGDAVMAALDALGIRVSTGSACASGARLPPEVLVAGGRSRSEAARAVRISVSWATADGEILALAAALPEVVARVRAARPTS